jgi:NADPH:quinone reductase-like Zn-dependent oxidoreductase
MSSKKQTVYRITERKGVDYLKSFQEDIPKINQHEVLIKIHAVSLNYRDLAILNNKYPMALKDNVVPCSDGTFQIFVFKY